ncbi:MAG: type III pantothenate kinase [Tahibacter sp.]
MNLLIDLGNSRLKWAWSDASGLRSGTPVDHSQPLDAVLRVAWRDAPPVDRVLIASVARPRLEAELAQAVRTHVRAEPVFVASRGELLGVRSAYARPEKLGVDRLLALVALHAERAATTVLASVGTALVLDAMDATGRHLGGLIAPSPALMQQALLGATARVSASEQAQLVEFADDTEDAVHSGCWLAAAALVERFYLRASEQWTEIPSLVLAGGAAGQLLPLLRCPARIETDLVLRGLALYAEAGC